MAARRPTRPPRPATPPSARELGRLLATAKLASREVGEEVLRAAARGRGQATVRRKGPGDFVTAVDERAERSIRSRILARHPDHGFLGEESAPTNLDAEYVWVVDPIDGTSNFANGLPVFAVSVACLQRGRPVASAVYCAPERRLYHAALGRGAFIGRRRLDGPSARPGDASLYGVQWHRGSNDLSFLPVLTADGARVRNLGCTVAHYCYVADGSLDANIQEQGRLWDFAAVALLATEAGLRCTDWSGKAIFPIDDLVGCGHTQSVVARPKLHRRLIEMLTPYADES